MRRTHRARGARRRGLPRRRRLRRRLGDDRRHGDRHRRHDHRCRDGGSAAPTKEIDLTVAGGKIDGDGPVRVTIDKGTKVTLKVDADVADEVHVHGYDLHGDVAPGKPATIRFTADVPGRFEAELESRGLQILQFTVNP